ncbi:MAG: hypothetical protein A3H98_02310 [Bacteroidetes bacterium RIFCSPLOWO2_02_FULL_36_8]|nr:MAG: hypothetical protein A3H98_02310 [Bacteroidetes bacterium RIFCSPLOWO2_02_FULL_36_8]OFY69175.1 MAG: hypothetical protein A3G23_06410 [Bacteroidetes bacterium RIFCSPLOWO2_12_FULL_37_12]
MLNLEGSFLFFLFPFIFFLLPFHPPPSYSQIPKADSLIALLSQTIHDTDRVHTLNTLAMEYKYSNPDTSYIILTDALRIAEKLKWDMGKANTLRNIGSLYAETGRYKSAEKYLDSALLILQEIGTNDIAWIYEDLSVLFEKQKKYKLANENFKHASKWNDSLFNEEKSKEIGGLEARHEWQIMELEKAKQEAVRKRQEAVALNRRNMMQYAGIALVLSILLLSLLNSKRIFNKLPEKIWRIKLNRKSIVLGLLFATIFIAFETLLIFFDAEITTFTRNKVVYKTLMSCLFAGMVSVVYYFSEKRMAMTLGFNFKHKEHEGSTKNTKFFILFFVFFLSAFVSSWQNKTDSLKMELQKNLADTTRIKTLNNLSWEESSNDPSQAIKYAKKALVLAIKIKNDKQIANSFHHIAWDVYIQGNFLQSLNYNFKALKIRKKIDDKIGISSSLGNIGLVYYYSGDNPNALKHYMEALEIDKASENKNGMARHISNIGNVYLVQGNFTHALKNYFVALEIEKELGNKDHIAIITGNIGNVYVKMGDFPKALRHYFEALEIAKAFNNKNHISYWFGSIGSLYGDMSRYKEAEAYLDSALQFGKIAGDLFRVMEVYNNFSYLYENTARYELALYHYKKYDATKDSLFNEEKSKEIGKLETRHLMDLEEFERKKKSEQETAAALIVKAREDKIGYTLVLMGFIVVLIISMLLSRLALPSAVIQIATTVPFLLLFEAVIVFTDPFLEQFAANAPAWKLTGNFMLGLLLFPLHEKAEELLKKLFRRKLEIFKHKDTKTRGVHKVFS